MTIYVLDTDTVTFQQQRRQPILDRLDDISPSSIFTTVVTMREQIRGRLAVVDKCSENAKLLSAYKSFQNTVNYFNQVNVLPFSLEALEVLTELCQQRLKIGTQDLRIAAIALSVNGILVTSNNRDFRRVPGLVLEDWNQ